jgi:hypothetical protein
MIVLAFVALMFVLAWRAVSYSPYSYDEADYMYAAKLGLVANYTDTPTISVVQFLRIGLNRGRDSRQASGLSEMIRGTNAVDFYRHWHGPLYFYWLILTSHLGLDGHGMRCFTLVFPFCSLAITYFGSLWILGKREGILAAVLGSALFGLSVTTIRSMELAPHQAFVCFYLACLVLLCKTVATGKRLYFYLAVVAAAFSCCLLEVGFVVVLTVIVCGYRERNNLSMNWAFAMRSLLAFLVTVLLIWPTAIVKLSFIKGYVIMAYLAIVRKSPFGHEGFFETWQKRIYSSPIEWLVMGAAVLIWIFARRHEVRRHNLYPFLFYAALMLGSTLRVTTGSTRYSLPFEPALDVLAGCTLAGFLTRSQRTAVAYMLAVILSMALFVETLINLKQNPVVPDASLSAVLLYVRENHLDGSRLLVPQTDVPTLHYYFPNLRLRGYSDQPPELSSLRNAQMDGLLYPGLPIHYEPLPSK